MRLPVYSDQVSKKETAALPGESRLQAANRKLRILLVEDNGDTAQILKRLLVHQGHQVQTAADVATALELAERDSFDLLLSDLGLPDRSGLELMRELRAKGRNLPGIALSGYGQEQDIRQSREAGFVEHLVKPVSIQQLHRAIVSATSDGGRNARGG